MDYEFIFETRSQSHRVEISAEHQALARCLNQELEVKGRNNESVIDLIQRLEQVEQGQVKLVEWTIEVDKTEIKVNHNSRYSSDQELFSEDGMQLLDWEFCCECGKLDLIELLWAWYDFIQS